MRVFFDVNTGHIGEMQTLQKCFGLRCSLFGRVERLADFSCLIELQNMAAILAYLYLKYGVFILIAVTHTVDGNCSIF